MRAAIFPGFVVAEEEEEEEVEDAVGDQPIQHLRHRVGEVGVKWHTGSGEGRGRRGRLG